MEDIDAKVNEATERLIQVYADLDDTYQATATHSTLPEIMRVSRIRECIEFSMKELRKIIVEVLDGEDPEYLFGEGE